MTANQIAAQSERELERHNQAGEEQKLAELEESIRHNKAMEFLTEEQNQIQQAYNNAMVSLKERYDTTYLEYLQAAEEDKVALESELNQIKWLQAQEEANYKQQMAAISKASQEADVAYKTITGQASYMNAETQAKRVEYEKHQWDTENYLRTQEYGLRHEELLELQRYHDLQVELGIKEANAKLTQNYLRSQELEWQKQYQGSMLQMQQALQPYNIDKLEAETKYINANKFNVNVRSFDILNPFSSSKAGDAINFGSKLIQLVF